MNDLKQADPNTSEEYELSDVSDEVRVQKSPELISGPCEVPVLRRRGFEERSTPFAGRQSRLSSICLCYVVQWSLLMTATL